MKQNIYIYYTWGIAGLLLGLLVPTTFIWVDLIELEMSFSLKNILWVVQSQKILYFSVYGFPAIFFAMGNLIAINYIKNSKIKRNEQYLKRIMNTITDQLVLVDNRGQMSSYNQSFIQKLLYTQEDLKDMPFNSILKTPWLLCTKFFFNKDNQIHNLEVEIIKKDGNSYPALLSAAPLYSNKNNSKHVCILKDITNRKDIELELIQERERTAHDLKLKTLGEMAAGVAHEINNPLTIIKSYVFLIQKKISNISPQDEDIQKYMEAIRNGTDRVAKIIKGLKSFSRDGSKDPFINTPFNLILEDTLNLTQKNLEHNQIKIDTSDVDSTLSFECQAVQICQILVNLFSNSKDAIIDQKKDRWIKIKAIKDDDLAQIYVIDSGKGIPKDIRNNMLNPFFTTKEVGKGTGLGLSLCRGIAEKHNGTLTYIEETPNTTFKLSIPLHQHQHQHQQQ